MPQPLRRLRLLPLLTIATVFAGLLVACGGDPAGGKKEGNTGTGNGTTSGTPDFKLAADPGEPIQVLAARETEAGTDVIVEGRIKDTQARFFAFTMIDLTMKYCGEENVEECQTPWDYCCDPADVVATKVIPVRFVDADGKPVRAPEGHQFDWRNLDKVKVKGTVRKLEDGTVVIAATGYFREERPKLTWTIAWPEEVADKTAGE